MNFVSVVSAVLLLLAGIGIFLIACQMMSSNLESISSKRLKSLFSRASSNKFLGVGIGTIGTAAIQSSGATTVMVIGFVNAGIISLTQAATIIYGANIGTTITAQIVALGMFGKNTLSTSIIFSSFAGVGAFIALFSKVEFWKKMGGILTGFGMLFVGLDIMSSSMSDFAALDAVKVFLAGIDNWVLLVIIGAIFTAIIQSSSVVTSIAIAMVVTGLVNLDQGIFITMGSNIGSCIVAIIAGVTSSLNAKRTAMIHLVFNCSGVVIFMIIATLLFYLSDKTVTFGTIFESVFPGAPQTQLAMFHTIFNVFTVIIVLPMTTLLVNFVCKAVKKENLPVDPNAPHLQFIDEHMLSTPPVAVDQTKREIIHMADLAMDNFNRSLDIISTMDFSEVEKFDSIEDNINYLNMAITDFVVKLSDRPQLAEEDRLYLSTTYKSVRDIERIGDYAENIVEYAKLLKDSSETFSEDALKEISQLKTIINEQYKVVMQAYSTFNFELLDLANTIEDDIDNYTQMMEDNHISRLSAGICTANVGAQYLSLSSNAERVADHLINIAKSIRQVVRKKEHPYVK